LIIKGKDPEVFSINTAGFDKDTLLEKIAKCYGKEARRYVEALLKEK